MYCYAAVSHSGGYKVKQKHWKARLMAGMCVAMSATSTELRVHSSEVVKQSKTTFMGGVAVTDLSVCLPPHTLQ